MDFFSPGFSKQLDDSGASCTSDDGVVHQNHSFPLTVSATTLSLIRTLSSRAFLTRCDKGSADVFVFDESDAIWNARLSGVTDRCVESGVRYADNHICLNRMFHGKAGACLQSRFVDAHSFYDRIRSCKIDILKDAELLRLLVAVVFDRSDTVFSKMTISPGSISLTYFALTASRAQVSEAMI